MINFFNKTVAKPAAGHRFSINPSLQIYDYIYRRTSFFRFFVYFYSPIIHVVVIEGIHSMDRRSGTEWNAYGQKSGSPVPEIDGTSKIC
jgi:hypothetical protein